MGTVQNLQPMKRLFLSIVTAAMVAATPLFAQQDGASDQDQEEAQTELKTGVRFVNCSPVGKAIPAPLFCKVGKSYRQIRIATRVPSTRVKPTGGVINFYDEDPTPAKEGKDAKGKGGKGGKAKADEEIKPVMTLQVPEDKRTGKVLCILRPVEIGNPPYKMNPLFIDEKDFPKSGVYIINFTDTPLEMKVSESADGSYDDSKVHVLKPCPGGNAISADNTWKSPGKADGTTLSFILSAKGKDGKTTRIKASRFTISGRQSQINIVVKDAKTNRYTMQSIQLTDKSGKPTE